jgi:hypothetical protein
MRLRETARHDLVRFLDSYASLLVLLIANFLPLQIVDDPRWGAIGSTLLAEPHRESEFLYFSFVTPTTLGFGDLSRAVGLPQGLTVLEALTGQIFLVTMVARLVTIGAGRASARTSRAACRHRRTNRSRTRWPAARSGTCARA